jgi:hypothetical protein
MTSPFGKGGSRGILSNKSPLTPLFQRGELSDYPAKALTNREVIFSQILTSHFPRRRMRGFIGKRRILPGNKNSAQLMA